MTTPGGSGRCLCGGVSFVLAGRLREVLNCHCHRCRRFTGHHLAATSAAVTDIELNDAEHLLTWFFPVAEAGYAFCARCGSSLFWRGTDRPERISICAGALDQPTGLETVAAWWVSQAGDYYARAELPEEDTEP